MQIPLGKIRRLWGWDSPFCIETESNGGAKHNAIIASTGAGKSTLLKHIFSGEVNAGSGVILQDPHGDLYDWALRHIPKHRANDVILFAPAYESASYPGINPVIGTNLDKRVKDTLSLVASLWEGGWGPQSDFISRNIGAAISEVISNPTLLHYDQVFMDRGALSRLAEKARSPRATQFFGKMLEDWDKRQAEQAAAPPTNKFNTFMQPVLMHVVGNPNSLDFERILAEQKILLCRLPIGELGEDIASNFSHLIQSELLLAGYARQNTKDRPHVSLIVDEAQKLAKGHDQERFFNEMRKYNLSLTNGYQAVAQIPAEARTAIFNNSSSVIVGNVGAEDSEVLSAELGLPEPRTLLQLTAYHWYGKSKRNGITSDPLLFHGLPEPRKTGKEADPESIQTRSKERYETSKDLIEARIEHSLRTLKEVSHVRSSGTRSPTGKAARRGQAKGHSNPAQKAGGAG